jgi:hypothetical protein
LFWAIHINNMAKNEIIVEVTIDSKQAEANAAKLAQTLFEQRKELAAVREAFKASNGTNLEASKRMNALEEAVKATTTELNQERKAMVANANSLEALRAITNQMTRERNGLNTGIKEQADRYKELTEQIKANNELINEQSKAAGSFKDNIGNYAGSIKEAIAGNMAFGGSFTQFIEITQIANTTFKAFNITLALNPIGAIIAAVVLLTAALYAFFTQTKEGRVIIEKAFAGIMAVLKVVLNLYAQLGKAIFEFIVDPVKTAQKAWENLKALFKDGIPSAINKSAAAMGNFAKEAKKAADEAMRLAELRNIWQEQARDAEVAAARAQKLAEQYRKLRDDETLSFKERQEANKQVAIAEKERAAQLRQVQLLKEREIELELKAKYGVQDMAAVRKQATQDELQALSDIRKELELIDEDYAGRTTEVVTEGVSLQKEAETARLELKKKRLEGELIGTRETSLEAYRLRQEILEIERKQALINLQASSDERLAVIQDFNNKRKELELEYRASIDEIEATDAEQDEEEYSDAVSWEIEMKKMLAVELMQIEREEQEQKEENARQEEERFARELERDMLIAESKKTLAQAGMDATRAALEFTLQAFGKESKAYKALLAVQRAATIASMTIKLQEQLQNIRTRAAELGLPLGPIYAGVNTASAIIQYVAGTAKVAAAGFQKGGYTGAGSDDEVAGQVHKNEVVIPAPVVRKYGVDFFTSFIDGAPMRPSPTAAIAEQGRISREQSIYVAVTDINKGQQRYAQVAELANS